MANDPTKLQNRQAVREIKKFRFEEQCFLLWNWEAFYKANLGRGYENFTLLMGAPSSIINRLLATQGLENLFEMMPYEHALLVPKIRIFKTAEHGGDEELMFSDHTTPESIEKMMSSAVGRGDGLGIKSFDYDLQGGSKTGGAALVKKGVTKINFKFLFQNLEMLTQRTEGHPALIDLVSLPNPTSKDVPTCPDDGKPANLSQLWDTKAFQMKVVYGWQVPQGDFISTALKEAIRASSTILMVNYEKHDLDFKQDGRVELTVTSNGYADSVLSDPLADILWLGAVRQSFEDMAAEELDEAKLDGNDLREDLEDAEKAKKIEEDAGDDSYWFNPWSTDAESAVDELEGELEAEDEKMDNLQKGLNQRIIANRVHVYNRLTDMLNKKAKIFYVDLSPEEVSFYESEIRAVMLRNQLEVLADQTQTPEVETRVSELQLRLGLETMFAKLNSADGFRPQEATGIDARAGSSIIAYNNDQIVADIERSIEKEEEVGTMLKNHTQKNLATTAKPSTKKRIYYIYYGDLLDVAFSVLKQNVEFLIATKNLRALLGPLTFTDAKTKVKKIINLADVPISLNKFLEWWNRNVVGKNRREYLLQDFIRDTIKDLIHAALGESCWDSTLGAPPPEVSIQPLVVPGKGEGGFEDRIPKGIRINADDISSVDAQTLIPDATHREMLGLHIYIYIYSYTWSSDELRGDAEEDYKKGIYHLQIGGDRGLVKSMKFGKIGNAKLDASRATKQACGFRHLQQQYKVTVEMIGNAIFKPGQFIFINATTMGSGDPQSRRLTSEKLGLGGYYTIVKVSGDVTQETGFRTTIEAIRQHGPNYKEPKTLEVIKPAPKSGWGSWDYRGVWSSDIGEGGDTWFGDSKEDNHPAEPPVDKVWKGKGDLNW